MPGTPTTKYAIPTLAGSDLARDIDTNVNAGLTAIDSKMVGYSAGLLSARPTSTGGSPGIAGRRYRATDTGQEFIDTGTGWVGILTSIESGHTFAIAGEIRIPSGQVDVIPGIWVPVLSGRVVRLKRVRYVIGVGTSVTFKLQRNDVDIGGLTGLVADGTADETVPSGGPLSLTNNDYLRPVVTAVSGTPQNMNIMLVLEHSV